MKDVLEEKVWADHDEAHAAAASSRRDTESDSKNLWRSLEHIAGEVYRAEVGSELEPDLHAKDVMRLPNWTGSWSNGTAAGLNCDHKT